MTLADPPLYEKNKLLLNKYLGDFMHFETIFFFAENDFFKPIPPTKVRKIPHFFLKPSLKDGDFYRKYTYTILLFAIQELHWWIFNDINDFTKVQSWLNPNSAGLLNVS